MSMKGEFALIGVVAPVSQGVGAVSTAWVDASRYADLFAVIHAGVLGAAATLDAKLQQATAIGGTGVKDVTGAAITQLVKATDDGKAAIIHCRAENLDVNGGFSFVRLTLTVAAAASLVSGELYGLNPRYSTVTHDAALKEQIITP